MLTSMVKQFKLMPRTFMKVEAVSIISSIYIEVEVEKY